MPENVEEIVAQAKGRTKVRVRGDVGECWHSAEGSPHPNPLPDGARGLTERVDSIVGRIKRSRRIRHSFSNMVSEAKMFDSLAKAGKYLGQAAN